MTVFWHLLPPPPCENLYSKNEYNYLLMSNKISVKSVSKSKKVCVTHCWSLPPECHVLLYPFSKQNLSFSVGHRENLKKYHDVVLDLGLPDSTWKLTDLVSNRLTSDSSWVQKNEYLLIIQFH